MQTSDRRALLAGLGATLLTSIGCDNEPKPSTGATLFNNKEVHEAVKGLVEAVDNLGAKIEAFDTENWKEVVPDVRSAAGDVGSALGTLKKALGYSDSE